MPKPAREIRQVFSKSELIRPTYTQGLPEFYEWLTEGSVNTFDSRSTPKWSAILSRLDNALFGGIGPQDGKLL